MNLFRSEGHVRNWTLLADGAVTGIADPSLLLAGVFTLPRYTRRLDADYLDKVGEHSAGLPDALKLLSADPWWSPV